MEVDEKTNADKKNTFLLVKLRNHRGGILTVRRPEGIDCMLT